MIVQLFEVFELLGFGVFFLGLDLNIIGFD